MFYIFSGTLLDRYCRHQLVGANLVHFLAEVALPAEQLEDAQKILEELQDQAREKKPNGFGSGFIWFATGISSEAICCIVISSPYHHNITEYNTN